MAASVILQLEMVSTSSDASALIATAEAARSEALDSLSAMIGASVEASPEVSIAHDVTVVVTLPAPSPPPPSPSPPLPSPPSLPPSPLRPPSLPPSPFLPPPPILPPLVPPLLAPTIGQRIDRYTFPIILIATLIVMAIFATASRGTDVERMPWEGPCGNGRTVLFFTLATSNFDFFGDLLYFAVNFVDGGYQHASLTVASFAAFVAPAVAFALLNGFFREFVTTGSTITPKVREKLDRFLCVGVARVGSSLPSTIMWSVSRLLLLGLVPLLLLLWTLVLLGTLMFGVNMKLFALPGFLRIYRQLLSHNRWQEPEEEDQVVALNEALFLELALESVPEMCVVIINEFLTPGPWSSLAIVALGGSGFFVLCLLWKFADRIQRKGFRKGLRVPVLACTPGQSKQIKEFVSISEIAVTRSPSDSQRISVTVTEMTNSL